jgi:hypothetical protein
MRLRSSACWASASSCSARSWGSYRDQPQHNRGRSASYALRPSAHGD